MAIPTIEMSFPVKAHLKKYLYFVENLKAQDTLDLTKPGTCTYVLKLLLSGKSNIPFYVKSAFDEEYNDKMYVLINARQFNQGEFYMSPKAIRTFNQFLHRKMHEQLLQRILLLSKYKTTEKEVIYDFMRELDMEEDISFDALKKASYRLRKSKNFPLFRQQVCISPESTVFTSLTA